MLLKSSVKPKKFMPKSRQDSRKSSFHFQEDKLGTSMNDLNIEKIKSGMMKVS
jgi:hypothetical protein